MPAPPGAGAAADAIRLSLFASRVAAICDEMGALLGRVAFSPNIRDRLDYSCALFDPQGHLLGQATHIPVHLGSMAFAMRDLVGKRRWHPGDMLVLNDPFRGGTHLPDVTFVAPVFLARQLVGFCANRAHHADIGAEAPGSMPVSGSLAEEGVLISPRKLIRRGELDEQWLSELLGRLNDPAAARGDFSAQIAANRLGVQRLQALVEAFGVEPFGALSKDLQAYAERLALASIGTLPAGRYEFADVLDDDGVAARDIAIHLALEIAPGGIHLDFAGSARQVPGNLNCPLSVTAAAVFYVFRCLMPEQVPACHGAMRPFTLSAPSGCLLNAEPPAAVAAGNVETSMRVVDVVCGALAKALPDAIPAASQGTMNNLAMGARGAEGWDYYETLAGGLGAGPDCDGRSARHSHMTNTLNTPVEILERHYPLRILRYAIRRDSGGRGRFRGGHGVIREYAFLAPAQCSIISERRRHAPWGAQGGAPGAAGRNLLDGKQIPPKCQQPVAAGQVLRIETPGGGGFGAG
ncbi:MAG: hydantoinase B/oxoprolinase family protein [Xanthomonadales bacterium]|nr:hydantoinase B/oxoprolinase family protein [Xanthomonadales bacterium]NIN59102.1 hydantoinase B/oxoprolinase family protein [Xanthomonadales bacterium]NIN74413.1 hydantoinase B/oxoprolinase family protein [Xanthomonadales bacterium]NIO13216.1 hydantoinase B/oxoprolinase family protein [Xanthomonadales bacterium]NIP11495.1 hydantoinase B/oxoprolinase family protein [Xanthomonadales bacterium]